LIERFDITKVTIRRDLALLEEKGLLNRTHGGAIKRKALFPGLTLSEKEKLNLSEKNKIAKEAAKMGNTKTFNMIVMGAYLKIKPIVKMENVIKGLKKSLPERHHHLIPLNEKAIKVGEQAVRKVSDAV